MSELGLGANMDLIFTVQTKIQKPVSEVFDAVHNPKKLSGYFTTGGSDGPLDQGRTVVWKFDDAGNEVITVPVKVPEGCAEQVDSILLGGQRRGLRPEDRSASERWRIRHCRGGEFRGSECKGDAREDC